MKTYDNSKQCIGTDCKSAPAGTAGVFFDGFKQICLLVSKKIVSLHQIN